MTPAQIRAGVVAEYKDVGSRLAEEGILSEDHGTLLRKIAGYRNRMVHFYHEVTSEELYRLCTCNLRDISTVLNALVEWIRNNPEKIDRQI